MVQLNTSDFVYCSVLSFLFMFQSPLLDSGNFKVRNGDLFTFESLALGPVDATWQTPIKISELNC